MHVMILTKLKVTSIMLNVTWNVQFEGFQLQVYKECGGEMHSSGMGNYVDTNPSALSKT